MIFDHTKDMARCPHCKKNLVLYEANLNLWYCPDDFTVYEERSFAPVTELSHSVAQTSGGPGHDTAVIAADHLPLCSITGKCD